jgi:hypothetical protein
MFGCLRNLGCLILLLAAAGGGYYWYTHRSVPSTAVAPGTWRHVTAADIQRGERALASLQSANRQAVSLSAAEAVGYLLKEIAAQLPESAREMDAMILGDTLNVRAVVPLRELGADKALGPLASFLNARDTVQLGGTVAPLRDGMAQFRVTRVTVHGLSLPGAAIPRLIAQLRRGPPPEGVDPNGFAVPLPPFVSDIRIAKGKVTVYKNS